SFECTEREVSRRTLIIPHLVGASLLANVVIQAGRFREQARTAKRTFADKRSVARSAPTESFECTEREVSRRTLIMPHIVGASLLANAVIQAGRFREQARSH
ncbi:hypothetical protein A247_27330, partial [Pseudomonas syringae pv. actinidiae ICMP 19099]